jgi:hypothetical protein
VKRKEEQRHKEKKERVYRTFATSRKRSNIYMQNGEETRPAGMSIIPIKLPQIRFFVQKRKKKNPRGASPAWSSEECM